MADYLRTLGARISKVLVKGSSNDGAEISDRLQQAKLEDNFVDPYGYEGGPLNGLIGTVDLRLQTITLIGSQELINTSRWNGVNWMIILQFNLHRMLIWDYVKFTQDVDLGATCNRI